MAEVEVRLKEVEYPGYGSHKGKVAYLVTDTGDIYFSGLTKIPSTINLAEIVIEAIYLKEGWKKTGQSWRNIKLKKIVDIQTHRGYASKEKGQFEADRLAIQKLKRAGGDTVIIVDSWTHIQLPPEVLEVFKDLIG